MASKELTSQQEMFLDYLFDGETVRNPNEAKQLAGYPKDYPVAKIIKGMDTIFIDRVNSYLNMYAPLAAAGLIEALQDPLNPGNKVKLQAIIEILDRGGVVKKEKSEVAQVSHNYIFTVPAKNEIKE